MLPPDLPASFAAFLSNAGVSDRAVSIESLSGEEKHALVRSYRDNVRATTPNPTRLLVLADPHRSPRSVAGWPAHDPAAVLECLLPCHARR